ncbi:DUF3352 domain-containing protein [Phycicoccus flavus]|uniref:DUF3352 domain-containing protein n=1 Tax=Phycicoccus flavus TaxID=2502783 RepID=UPI000FEC0B97|nr:DUF3352 domain-containing protein [Phycicoccus flavus]NHA66701.1 hypothetical protein [Phycicoccus flavus]
MSSMLPPSEPPRWPGGPGPWSSFPQTPDEPAAAAPSEPVPGAPGTEPTVVETTGGQGGRGLVYGLVGGGVAAALALGGAGVWAWSALGGGGDRPAVALPASTFFYAAVDLDPAAGQKIEAFRTLNKFPAFSEAGLEDDGELSGGFWDTFFDTEDCANFDAAKDVTPWLGQRAAFAGVALDDDVVPVGVVQVTDPAAAPAGLLTLKACDTTGDATSVDGVKPTWVVRDGWAYVGRTEKSARAVADAAASGTTLADSPGFTSWMDSIGDQGVLTLWAAPKPGQKATALLRKIGSDPQVARLGAAGEQFDTFQGGAATLRFADGGLEMSIATGMEPGAGAVVGTGLGDAMSDLPDDTLAAVGLSTGEGWSAELADSIAQQSGGEIDAQAFYDALGEQTGLSLPGDLDALLGKGVVVSLGGDVDPRLFSGRGDPMKVPAAATFTGEPAEIERVLGKLASLDPSAEKVLATTRAGEDRVVVGPNGAYRKAVAAGGGLGDEDRFTKVVPHADEAVFVFYLDLDGADNWLVNLAAEDDEEAAKNLEPLSAVGISSWVEDDDVLRTTVRAMTD